MSNGAHKLGFRGWLAIKSSMATIVATVLAVVAFLNPFLKENLSPSEPEQTAPTPTNQGIPEPTPALPATTPTPISDLEPDTPTPPTPTATPSTAPKADTATPAAAIEPTATSVPALKYPSPELLGPPDAYPLAWKAGIVLKWRPVGQLAADEYYYLHLDAYRQMDDSHWYGDYIFTKDTTLEIEPGFLAPFHPPQQDGFGEVRWWVHVVRKTSEDEHGKPQGVDLGHPSQKWTFVTEPKPGE